MQLVPLLDYVLVEVPELTEKERKTETGILIAEQSEKKLPIKGKVLAVGPGRFDERGILIPIDGISVGDTVFFEAYALEKVEVTKEEIHCFVLASKIFARASA